MLKLRHNEMSCLLTLFYIKIFLAIETIGKG